MIIMTTEGRSGRVGGIVERESGTGRRPAPPLTQSNSNDGGLGGLGGQLRRARLIGKQDQHGNGRVREGRAGKRLDEGKCHAWCGVGVDGVCVMAAAAKARNSRAAEIRVLMC